jgi:hypothetical protein
MVSSQNHRNLARQMFLVNDNHRILRGNFTTEQAVELGRSWRNGHTAIRCS